MKSSLRRHLTGALVLALALAAGKAGATFHTFQIQEVYSNGSGTIQYVVLREAAGMNGQNFLSGHTFTATAGGSMQTYEFPLDLPGGMETGYGFMQSPTAFRSFLMATAGFAALNIVKPDYVMPNGFIPLTNGTLNYAGVDQVSYAALPTDGTNALSRSGAVVPNMATNFAGLSGSVTAAAPPPPPPSQTTLAVEYYYDVWNFYFETAFVDEIAALDGGAFGGVWKRTGQTFNVWSQASANAAAVPTCRFFSTAFAPKSSHFYTPFANECALRKTDPGWAYEAIAFYVQLTDANGLCPAGGTVPLYRVYNNGMGGAPNHRYTTDRAIRDQMLALGWLPEGNGPDVIFACVPQ
jgi:hypothetical protein